MDPCRRHNSIVHGLSMHRPMMAQWAETCSDAVQPTNSIVHSGLWATWRTAVFDRKNENSYIVLTHTMMHSLKMNIILPSPQFSKGLLPNNFPPKSHMHFFWATCPIHHNFYYVTTLRILHNLYESQGSSSCNSLHSPFTLSPCFVYELYSENRLIFIVFQASLSDVSDNMTRDKKTENPGTSSNKQQIAWMWQVEVACN